MPAAPLLSEDELRAALDELSDWELLGGRLVRRLRFAGFRPALEFVNRVADVADAQDHHPDVELHWADLKLTLWTHAAGGITRRDVRLARSIDELARAR